MSLVLVTGTSGSGKSAVCQALKREGHSAVDGDWEGYNHWVDRASGQVVADPPYPVPPGWLDRFAWMADVERVEALAAASRESITFWCGQVENEAAAWHCFDHVVCLVVSDDVLGERLATRTTNAFGKNPEELAAAMAWNPSSEARYRRLGATIIDATEPIEEVTTAVLRAALQLKHPSRREV